MIDIEEIRNNTPGCKTKIHFNNAGASLPPYPVVNAAIEYLTLESQIGGYETAVLKQEEIKKYYKSAARLLNTKSKNIAFTTSSTNSFSRALSAIPFKKNDYVLIANEDYISNQLTLLSLQKRYGIKLLRANSLPEGGIDVDHVERLSKIYHLKLIAISHIPSHIGSVQPVEEIGKICRKKDILYLVDACQSIGQIPVDVATIQCDFLTLSMRKFLRGPRGAGILYVSDKILELDLEPLCIDSGGAYWSAPDSYRVKPDATRFEEWERSFSLVVASKVAIDYALQIGIQNIQKRNRYLCKKLLEKLPLPDIRVVHQGSMQSSIITLLMPHKKESDTIAFLHKKNINASLTTQAEVRIDFATKKIHWGLRISPHYFNTETEIDTLTQTLEEWSQH